MTKLEQELLSKIENEGIESIKENSELWIYLNEKRVVRKERLIPNVSPENLEQLNEGVPKKPKPPLICLIREGTIGTCPKCHSTEIKRFILFAGALNIIIGRCPLFYFQININPLNGRTH